MRTENLKSMRYELIECLYDYYVPVLQPEILVSIEYFSVQWWLS